MTSDISTPRTARRSATGPVVGEVMRPAATTVESAAHLAAAAYLIRHSGDGALVVTTDDTDRRPLAVLTERDVTRAVADGRDVETTRIEDLWSEPPVTVAPDVTIDEAGRTMLAHRVHHLPVVEAGRLVGIVDMSDLCRALLRPDERR